MYNAFKTDLATFLGISKDALHVHIGLAVFFVAVVILRKSPGSLVPWILVLAFEVANELMDIFHWYGGAWTIELGDSAKDIIGTMLWPTLIMLLARFGKPWRGAGTTGAG